MQEGTNAVLRMEAAYSTEMPVPIYRPHHTTLQNMASLIFIDKIHSVYPNTEWPCTQDNPPS